MRGGGWVYVFWAGAVIIRSIGFYWMWGLEDGNRGVFEDEEEKTKPPGRKDLRAIQNSNIICQNFISAVCAGQSHNPK